MFLSIPTGENFTGGSTNTIVQSETNYRTINAQKSDEIQQLVMSISWFFKISPTKSGTSRHLGPLTPQGGAASSRRSPGLPDCSAGKTRDSMGFIADF